MTNVKAIYELKKDCHDMNYECACKGSGCGECYINFSIEALEKQIPYREDVSIGSTKLRKCKCGIHYSQKDIKYCSCCGQAIDWSE